MNWFRFPKLAIQAGFVLAVAILLTTAGITYRTLSELGRVAEREQQVRADLEAIAALNSSLTDAETGRRGYILTGEEWHLDGYRDASLALAAQLNAVEQLLLVRLQDRDRFERLQQLVEQRLNLLAESIATYHEAADDRDAQQTFTNQGKILHDQIRVLLTQIERETWQDLEAANQPLLEQTQRTVALAFGGFSISVAMFVLAALAIARQNRQRQRAIAEAESSRSALQASEDRFRATFEQAAVGIAHVSLQGRFLRVNRRFGEILGYSPAELLRLSFQEITDPDYLESSLNGLRQLLAGKLKKLALEKRYRCRDGSYIWGNVTVSLVRTETGDPDYFISVIEDTNARQTALRDRQAAELALRESEARYSSLTNDVLDKSAVGIFILDADFRVVWVNQALTEFFDVRREEVIGRDKRQLIRDRFRYLFADSEAFANRVLATYAQNDYIEHFECRALPEGDRPERWLEHLSQPIRSGSYAGGRIEHYTDITDRKRAEAALWESEQRVRQFVEHAPSAVAMLDRDLRYLLTSRRWLSDYRLGEQAILGRSHYEIFPEIPERWREIHRRCLHGDVLRCEEDCLERRDGSLDWLNWEVRPWTTSQGEIGGIIIFSEVITQRKEAELALRQSEARNQAIVEAIPDLLLRIDADGYYRDYIPAKEQRELLSSDRVGRHLSEVLPPYLVDLQRYYIQQALATGQLQSFEQEFEIAGELYQEEVRLAVSGENEVLAIVRDITARKQAEMALQHAKAELEVRVEERTAALSTANERLQQELTERQQVEAILREAERRWRSLLENVRLAVIGLDLNGCVEYANPFFLELTGYEEREILGQDWLTGFIPVAQQSELRELFNATLNQEQPQSYHRNTILTKAGEERIFAWNNTLLQDTNAQPIGTLSIGSDITESYAMERMKDEFISVVSHELRTPLTSIHGGLNLLASGSVSLNSERGDRIVQIAADSAERLTRLVNDILELERLESGKIRLSKQWVNSAELIDQAVEQMQVVANRARISLDVVSTAVEFYADPDRILQVLTNLLSNAIKFSHPGTTVRLSVERGELFTGLDTNLLPQAQQFAIFTVEDRGRGIPPEKLETIFERFHQVDASDSRKKGGTGLGLAICRSIVEQHSGRIWVESHLDRGSTFSFTLPICTEEEEDAALDEQPTLPAAGH